MELYARFPGIDIIQTDGITIENYRVTVSYKTGIVYRDGINTGTFYPWHGMTGDDFVRTFADEFPGLTNEQMHRIADYVGSHIVTD